MDVPMRRIIINVIKRDLPHIRQCDLKWFMDGWDHVIVVVNDQTAYRFPRLKEYEAKIPVEVAFMNAFSAMSPVAIPRLQQKYDDVANMTFTTYDYIRGTRLSRDFFGTLEKEKQIALAKQLGAFLTALHSFSIPRAKKIGVTQTEVLTFWKTRLEIIRDVVFPHIGQPEQEWINRLFQDFIALLAKRPFQLVLTHGDLAPEHILVDPQTHVITGIIDFGDVAIDDPAYDFQCSRYYGKEFLHNVYGAYTRSRDEVFDLRRQFYEDRLPVTNLEHSIKIGEPEWIQKHKEQLSIYIANAPLH